jgi:hypothetical protein
MEHAGETAAAAYTDYRSSAGLELGLLEARSTLDEDSLQVR